RHPRRARDGRTGSGVGVLQAPGVRPGGRWRGAGSPLMRSFTDLFIRHPVLAAVVNLAIVLMGWRALTTLPVQQYPNIQSSSVVITTVYYGARDRKSVV